MFVGAGTSGRLGVLEAAECPPTFNTKPGEISAAMAGGKMSVFASREGVAGGRVSCLGWRRCSLFIPLTFRGAANAKRRGA